jgi:hypothetical protein
VAVRPAESGRLSGSKRPHDTDKENRGPSAGKLRDLVAETVQMVFQEKKRELQRCVRLSACEWTCD